MAPPEGSNEAWNAAWSENALRCESWPPHPPRWTAAFACRPGRTSTPAPQPYRADCGGDRVVILALSASALEHQRTEILASGCDDFLPKPFREGMIFAKMAEYLDLNYVYENPGDRGGEPAMPASAIDPAQWSRLPADWIANMRRALAAGDVQAAANGLAAIEPGDPELAAQMRAMLVAYRLDELDALLATANDRAP